MAFSTSKKPPKSVPSSTKAPFVWGSKPASLRAPYPPRIEPAAASTRQYGKKTAPNPGFGDTGTTGFS